MDLNTIWFALVGVLIAGYAVLDGFDLGVGTLHLFAKSNDERRINLNAIGPVWDGNEVWLLTGGGALFAAFPAVYATVFSAFYLALMLLLAALIFRAVSIEFRGKVESDRWRRFWDWGFGLGSLLPSILFGVAVGNVLRGLPIDTGMVFKGSFIGLLNPYSILIGLVSLVLFVTHGAIYMTMKCNGSQRDRMVKVANGGWMVFVVLYLIATIATIFAAPHLFDGMLDNPLFWVLLVLLVGSIVFIPIMLKAQKYFRAFLGSSAMIVSMIGLAAVGMFPNLVPSSIDPSYSLSIYNASSTPRTLTVMLIIALIGMPIVIAYTAFIYRVFKGKVVITPESY
jgi:cytochrome d ubiquinol oxidase subunit II